MLAANRAEFLRLNNKKCQHYYDLAAVLHAGRLDYQGWQELIRLKLEIIQEFNLLKPEVFSQQVCQQVL